MIGHVATTSVVAQMIAGRNGRSIQKQAAISPATKRTARVVRVRSDRPSIPRRRTGGSRPLFLRAHHQLQAVSIGIPKVNAVIVSRAAGNGNTLSLKLSFKRFVCPRRDVESQMI